jgi:two-component system sensor histidine kinase MprB
VTRVLVSLLTNAAHYSPDASIIDVETTQCADGRASIVVTDAGPGIPEDERGAVFDPYWRGDRARESYRGLGVGLSIARELCEMSGGEIHVFDAPDGGSRFEVDFPAAAS